MSNNNDTTPQVFQNTSCKDYLLTEFGNYNSDFEFEPTSLKNEIGKYPDVADKLRAAAGSFWTNYSVPGDGTQDITWDISYFKEVFPGHAPVSIISNPFESGNLELLEQGLSFTGTDRTGLLAERFSNLKTISDNGGTVIAIRADTNAPSFRSPSTLNPPDEFNWLRFYYAVFGPDENVQFEEGAVQWPPMISKRDERSLDFTDHSCYINAFYNLKEVSDKAVGTSVCYAEIKDQYNTYIDAYEKFTSGPMSDYRHETTLPNLYAFYLMKQDNASKDFENLITVHQTPEIAGTLGNKPKGEYFTKYAERRTHFYGWGSRPGSQSPDQSYWTSGWEYDKYKNIIIPYGDIQNNITYNENANLFPMSVNINFRTDSRTEFAEVLKQSQLSTTFMKYIVDLLETPNETLGIMDVVEYGVDRARRNVVRKFDLTKFIDLIESEDFLEELKGDKLVFLGMLKDEPNLDDLSDYSMIISLLSAIFSAKIAEIVNRHYRTFSELIAGKPAYSETVMYKICKYRGDGSGEPIQRIFLPNSNEIDIHNYIDTQVKYGEIYTYKIFGYEMVVGNKYYYSDAKMDFDFPDLALARVNQSISIQLIETELFTKVLAVVDHPPVAPEVDIVPFKGVNNKIRLLLNRSIGKVTTHPIAIEVGEQEKLDSYKILKDIAPDGPITYKSDDIPAYFEIYRMSEKPEKYQDFAGHKILKLETDSNTVTELLYGWHERKRKQTTASATYDDSLQPNQKYYYMFRSVDIHNNISLPTEVFEVEIIDENGVVYPRIKAIELKETNMNVVSKAFKRLLKIKPATSQLFFDETNFRHEDSHKSPEQIGSVTDIIPSSVKLGLADESIWSKKFKLRLTSRQTGKKIDINFQFEHNHIPPE